MATEKSRWQQLLKVLLDSHLFGVGPASGVQDYGFSGR